MPTAHLLSGLPCSGKSTFASSLVEENGGVLFSLDYWLITLHGRYSLEDIGYNEHVRRVLACRQIISGVACEFLRHGLDVVLDDGFFLSEHRIQQIAAFKSAVAHSDAANGVRVLTQVVHVAPDVLRARLERRNHDLPKHNFAVPLEALQRFIELYEEPSNDEGAELVYVDGSGSDKDGARVPNRVTDPSFRASAPPPQFNRLPRNFT